MKKYILIATLILINILFYVKNTTQLKTNIDINLKKDELGVVLFNYEPNQFILLKLNKKNIVFIIELNDINSFKENLYNLKLDLDYIIMNDDYKINLSNKKVVKDKLTLDNIEFSDKKIIYNNKKLCINIYEECDYNYITKEPYNTLTILNHEYKIYKNSYKDFKISKY